MKRISFFAIVLSMIMFCSCNGGEKAGAGSDTNPVLKPNVGGVSDDTTGRDSTKNLVDSSKAYAPTDTTQANGK